MKALLAGTINQRSQTSQLNEFSTQIHSTLLDLKADSAFPFSGRKPINSKLNFSAEDSRISTSEMQLNHKKQKDSYLAKRALLNLSNL